MVKVSSLYLTQTPSYGPSTGCEWKSPFHKSAHVIDFGAEALICQRCTLRHLMNICTYICTEPSSEQLFGETFKKTLSLNKLNL